MDDRKPYSYAILRFEHDLVRGETLNAGLVLLCAGELRARVADDAASVARAAAFTGMDPDVWRTTLGAVGPSLGAAGRRALEAAPDADLVAVLAGLLPKGSNCFKFSNVRSGVTTDASRTFELTFERDVAPPRPAVRDVEVNLNGRRRTVPSRLAYIEAVRLVFPKATDDAVYTVTYSVGERHGCLSRGQTVELSSGATLSVADTSAA